MLANSSPNIVDQSALTIIYSIKSSPNANYHQYQSIVDDDVEIIISNELVSVGFVNGYPIYAEPIGRAVNVEDEDEPFNAWVFIISNILVSIVLTLSGHFPYSHCQACAHSPT